jgi:hypothetical protein
MTDHHADPASRPLAAGQLADTADLTSHPRRLAGPRPDDDSETATLDHLAASIRRLARALRCTTEQDLQEDLAGLLAGEGYAAARERALGPADRPDFLLPGGIAVEVKVKGTAGQLERQVRRYLTHADINAVLVVTNRARHRALPVVIDGKPVRVVWIASVF